MTTASPIPEPADRIASVEMVDVKALNTREPGALYKKREKIFPQRVFGFFRNVKWATMTVALVIYYWTPWLRWDRGPGAPDQAVLIDIPGRRFYFFFIEIWPQEVYYITGILIIAALALFLLTAVAGRVWCGYACPQTVWVDLFLVVERFVEGDRNARMRLDKGPWTLNKLAKRTAKHSVWLAIAVLTGGAWVFYFADAPTLFIDLVTLRADEIAYVTVAVLTATTYILGGFAREQVCTYMCPWPRIQSAMIDEDSLIVSCQNQRGEPRGHGAVGGGKREGLGDCISCNQCVVVCPMGIDIRNGMQLECISCALCVDACNGVMDKIGKPRSLIGYNTMNLSSPLEVTVAAAGDDTLLAEIVRLTAVAEQTKAAYVRLADRAAQIYAPAVHLLALSGFLGWWLLGGLAWQPSLLIAVAVLIITCPCALGLAVPVVQVVASGLAMGRGVLVKSGDGFERLAQVDTLVFDKTGTLTYGRPELVNGDEISTEALALAASLAAGSRHPVCQAVVRAAGTVSAQLAVQETPGMGLEFDGQRLGNRTWCGVGAADAADVEDGNSELWFAQPGRAPIRFALRDQIKADAVEVIGNLQKQGWHIEIVSGDRAAVVGPVAQALNISSWRADCRPDEKVAHLQGLAAAGRKVAMIGDGMNDAPALAAAHASLSPARVADVAQAAADFVFQGEGLAPVATTLTLARQVRRLILQKFSLALFYNLAAVPLALAGFVTPLIAAIAMSSSSLLVTLNALRLHLGRLP